MTWLRRVLTTLGAVCLVVGIAGIAAHFLDPVSSTAAIIASFTPLAVISAVVAGGLFAASRRWIAVAVTLVVTGIGVWSQVPLYRAEAAATTDTTAADLRVMQANIMLGQADPVALVETVRAERVDVLTVIELTRGALSRLDDAGLRDVLPYAVTFPRGGGGGAGIYSRYPLTNPESLPGLELHNLRAELSLPGRQPIAMYALHPVPPYPEPAWRWATDLERLRSVLAADPRTLVIGADFNSTFDHKRFRDFLAGSGAAGTPGLLDAAEYVGAGIVATYPANRRIPAVLAIDRILTRGGTPISFRRTDIPGSDHYGVIGDIRFP